jgi:TonB-linked SusC/RagA family outer membrane protein
MKIIDLLGRGLCALFPPPILRIMKLTILIITVCLIQVSASTKAQITLNENGVSLQKALKSISKQSGYDFIYSDQDFKDAKPVSIKLSNVTLETALKQCFDGQPLVYLIEDKTVMVKRKEESLLNRIINAFNAIDVSGKVVDEKGLPLAGVTVKVKDKDRATFTDSNGEFSLKKVEENAVLVISYIGCLTKEINAKGSPAVIRLELSNSKLDEVHVIAYGTDTKRFTIGSVATITADDIAKQPVVNPLLALQGQAPGLTITATNGAPGASAQVQIRGQNSLVPGQYETFPFDQPLFIVDGVPFAPQNNNISLLPSIAGATYPNRYGGLSPFNSINPQDIESVSVLKDADATSIYGSQGAYGVILITTKKGKPGKTSLNATVNTGYNSASKVVKLLNTPQYLQLRKEALANDGTTLGTVFNGYDNPDLLVFDQNKYTNWSKQFYGKTSKNTDAHVSLSGGSASSTYIISGGYTNSDYNFPGNFAERRLTLHTGFHQGAFNNRLSIDFGSDLSYDTNNESGQPSVTAALSLPPNFPDLLDSSGNLVWNYKGYDLTYTNFQQYSYLKQPSNLHTTNFNNSLRLTYQLAKGLSLGANLGYSHLITDEYSATPLSALSPSYAYNQSSANFAINNFQTINIEPVLNYKRVLGNGELVALVGGTYKKQINSISDIAGSDYPSDALLTSIAGATTVSASNASSIYKYAAVFARIGYIYDGKYILNLTGRRDGSSNFGPDHQFGNFGSAGLGWIISQEQFFKSAFPFVSFAKLSGNYGTSGSDGIAPYKYQPFWRVGNSYSLFQGLTPYYADNLSNPNYSWALKKSLNIGLDLGFWHDRLLLNANWYRNRVGNELIGATLPAITGFNSVIENLPATVQNKGWEFTLTSNNIKGKEFRWSTNFNISFNRNKLLAFPGLATSPYASLYTIGQSTSSVIGFKYKGVNPATGMFEFYDGKGAVTTSPVYRTITNGGDYQPIANLEPKFFGGFGNTLSYNGLSLTAFFQFSKQTGRNYLYSIYSQQYLPGGLTNEPVEVLNHWSKPGDVSDIEKLTAGYSSSAHDFITSSGSYSDASYIRLKTLSLSYTITSAFIKKAGLTDFRIYANGQNLLTITNYKVGDPETPGQIAIIPIQRTIVFGLSFNL